MNKVIFIGRSGAGKTTLTQALLGEGTEYHKTQSVERRGFAIDTPGEYAETKTLAGALAVFTYEADVVGLIISANEPYSLFGPNITSMANREVIGIVTGLTKKGANPDRAERWLRLSGCKRIFRVDSKTGEGIPQLASFLQEFDPKAEFRRKFYGK
ncbi:MAG: ethanolamine utilization protein EutP [Clostridia bacterium]|nr:ethanolamine utilization protein EutP [Clostridia bacterium]